MVITLVAKKCQQTWCRANLKESTLSGRATRFCNPAGTQCKSSFGPVVHIKTQLPVLCLQSCKAGPAAFCSSFPGSFQSLERRDIAEQIAGNAPADVYHPKTLASCQKNMLLHLTAGCCSPGLNDCLYLGSHTEGTGLTQNVGLGSSRGKGELTT